ncbi:MAG: HD domain-containing protein [Alicyclobacillus sp.]|nr:HD domain-containing protein [Alicyclobacillus sp.]
MRWAIRRRPATVVFSTGMQKLVRNYLLGLLWGLFGAGVALWVLGTTLSPQELGILGAILAFSVLSMCAVETASFVRDLQPLWQLQQQGVHPQTLEAAYQRLLRLPAIAVRRVMGPHWLGVVIPAAGLTLLALVCRWVSLPAWEVLLAAVASVLLAGMHALVEFFLTQEISEELLQELLVRGRANGWTPNQMGRVLIPLKSKFRASAMFIGALPLCLLGVVNLLQLQTLSGRSLAVYVAMLAGVFTLGAGFAWFASVQLAESVERPLDQLLLRLREMEQGHYDVRADALYSDEFALVVAGLNQLAAAVEARDEANRMLLDSYFATLSAALDARDPYTAGHSLRVAEYAAVIGALAGMDEASIHRLRKAGWLHDIGKIGIRDQILLKEGRLTEEEFHMIRQHPVLGETILKNVQPAEAILPLLPGVRSHHERFDGKGYPDGLRGEEIPLDGRILAVADAFDAMTSDRPYRRGLPPEEAIRILMEGSGSQWDPYFVRLFVRWYTSTVNNSSKGRSLEKEIATTEIRQFTSLELPTKSSGQSIANDEAMH